MTAYGTANEPMDLRTAVALQLVIEEYRYYEGLVAKYEAKATAAESGSVEHEAAQELCREYRMAFVALRSAVAAFRGAYGGRTVEELLAIADAVYPRPELDKVPE